MCRSFNKSAQHNTQNMLFDTSDVGRHSARLRVTIPMPLEVELSRAPNRIDGMESGEWRVANEPQQKYNRFPAASVISDDTTIR